MGLQPELAEHGRGVEVADHRLTLSALGVVGEEVGAGEVERPAGGRTTGSGPVFVPSMRHCADAVVSPVVPTLTDLEPHVGEPGVAHRRRSR